MNIKTLGSQPILPSESRDKVDTTGKVKSEASSKDRDADGKRQDQGDEHPNRRMTEEEIQLVLEKIRELSGVKENNLQVRCKKKETQTIVYIEDYEGNVVRRLVEAELWSMLKKQDKTTGQIFDKAM